MEHPDEFSPTADKDGRIAALENEVRDLKDLLRENTIQRQELISEVAALKEALEEATRGMPSGRSSLFGPSIATGGLGAVSFKAGGGAEAVRKLAGRSRDSIISHLVEPDPALAASQQRSGGGHDVMSERAKATLLKLRVERSEQIRRDTAAETKRLASLALQALHRTRAQREILRVEFEHQLQRTKDMFQRAMDSVGRSQNEADPADYPPIDSGHPVAALINKMCDGVDHVVGALQEQWYTFTCFTRGPAPRIKKPKRYLDPVMTLGSYTEMGDRLTSYVTFASAVNLSNTEMRVPNTSHAAGIAVDEAYGRYSRRLEEVFFAIRLLRNPAQFSSNGPSGGVRTMALALRIASTVEITRDEVDAISRDFQTLARRHTLRCFQYIFHTVRIGRRYASVLHRAQKDRTRLLAQKQERDRGRQGSDDDSDLNILTSVFKPCGATCATCNAPVGCDDCAVIESHAGELRQLIIERRDLIRSFTDARVAHFSALEGLTETLMKVLHRYKVAAPVLKSSRKKELPPPLVEKLNAASLLVSRGEDAIRDRKQQLPMMLSGSSAAASPDSGGGPLGVVVITSAVDNDAPPPGVVSCVAQPQPKRRSPGRHAARAAPDSPSWESSRISPPPAARHHARPRPAPPGSAPSATARPAMLAVEYEVEPVASSVGPFGETLFPTDHYFRARRMHSSQLSSRDVLRHNQDIIASTAALPTQGATGVALGASLWATSPRLVHSATTGRR